MASNAVVRRALQYAFLVTLFAAFTLSCTGIAVENSGPYFAVSFPSELESRPLDGRLLLLISNDDSAEPRFQISDGPRSQLAFGIDVDSFQPGDKALFDASVFGYPLRSLSELPAGEYWVQAVLHRYETFNRADGHVVKLPMDRGEGQQWNRAPGNLLSTPVKISFDPSSKTTHEIVLNAAIPPIDPPEDSRYIKHIKIESKLLSEFWGRPMHLGAAILLPEGFEDHPDARYPLVIMHGHFSPTVYGFSESTPVAGLSGRRAARAQQAHDFYRLWTGENFPRVILVTVQHACPFYDDSYGVNSANVGPYGDAITHELIPHIENNYRGIGQGWARTLYGGSTGGWIVLGVQIFYPEEYNGAWGACPDPVDFRAYQIVDIYNDDNAYYLESPWKRTPKPGARDYLGRISSTMEEQNHKELVLGTKGRSGGQWDIWEAVFSPVGDDGYPKRIWDKMTGEIDREVAEYWRENYDLRYILERDWETLGPKLAGKLRIYVGDMDTFHLNNGVYLLEEFLESTTDPYYDGEVHYGDRFEHCWSGYPDDYRSNERMGYHERFIPMMVDHMLRTAPEGADVTSWRY